MVKEKYTVSRGFNLLFVSPTNCVSFNLKTKTRIDGKGRVDKHHNSIVSLFGNLGMINSRKLKIT